MPGSQKEITAGLLGVTLGLLTVGLVSRTPLRHLIQILPALLTLVMVQRKAAWARFAAMPIFIFWFLIMLGIWLFLLGLARVITGTYSPAEIFLTLVIGASSVLGLVGCVHQIAGVSRGRGVMAFLGFAVVQIGAMWISLQPTFARS